WVGAVEREFQIDCSSILVNRRRSWTTGRTRRKWLNDARTSRASSRQGKANVIGATRAGTTPYVWRAVLLRLWREKRAFVEKHVVKRIYSRRLAKPQRNALKCERIGACVGEDNRGRARRPASRVGEHAPSGRRRATRREPDPRAEVVTNGV